MDFIAYNSILITALISPGLNVLYTYLIHFATQTSYIVMVFIDFARWKDVSSDIVGQVKSRRSVSA